MSVAEKATRNSIAADAALGRGVLSAYSVPAFAFAFIHGPALSVLQGIYAKHFGLGLEEIAFVVFLARVFDAVTDPIAGYLSDAYRLRRGTRKPWILVGSIIAVVGCWFLYVPPGPVTVASFLLWYLVANLGWTIAEVPYAAWLAELSANYEERARIASWRAMSRYLGLMAFFALPILTSPFLGTTEFTPETLRWSSIFAVIATLVTALVAVLVVPNGAASMRREQAGLREAVRGVLRNPPLQWFTVMFALSGLGAGIAWGLVFFYIDGYLGLGAQFAGLLVLSMPVAFLATPVWSWACRRFGKQQAWAIGCAGTIVASLAFAAITPSAWAGAAVAATLLLFNALITVEAVAGPSVLADVVDYGRWRFGADYAGTYFAFYAMVQKINVGLGSGLGLYVAGSLGFDATLAQQSSRGILGLLVAYAVLPAVFYAGAAIMIWKFPIDRRRQRTLVRAIARRERAPKAMPAGIAP